MAVAMAVGLVNAYLASDPDDTHQKHDNAAILLLTEQKRKQQPLQAA
jgi:hypothetical protein